MLACGDVNGGPHVSGRSKNNEQARSSAGADASQDSSYHEHLAKPQPFPVQVLSEIEKRLQADPVGFLKTRPSEPDLLELLPEPQRNEFCALCVEHKVSLGSMLKDEFPVSSGLSQRLFELVDVITERCTDLWLAATQQRSDRAQVLGDAFLEQWPGVEAMAPLTTTMAHQLSPEGLAAVLRGYAEGGNYGWSGSGGTLLRRIRALNQEAALCRAIEQSLEETGHINSLQDLVSQWDIVERLFKPETVERIARGISEHAPHLWLSLSGEDMQRFPERVYEGIGGKPWHRYEYAGAVEAAEKIVSGELGADFSVERIREAVTALVQKDASLMIETAAPLRVVLGEERYLSLLLDRVKRGASDELQIHAASLLQEPAAAAKLEAAVTRAFLESPRLVVGAIEQSQQVESIPGYSPSSAIKETLDFAVPLDMYGLLYRREFLEGALSKDGLRKKLISRVVASGNPELLEFFAEATCFAFRDGAPKGAPPLSQVRREVEQVIVRHASVVPRLVSSAAVEAALSKMSEGPDSGRTRSESSELAALRAQSEEPYVEPEALARARIVRASANWDHVEGSMFKDYAESVLRDVAHVTGTIATERLAAMSLAEELTAPFRSFVASHPLLPLIIPGLELHELRSMSGGSWEKLPNTSKRAIVACCLFDELSQGVQEELQALDAGSLRGALSLIEAAVSRRLPSLAAASLGELRDDCRAQVRSSIGECFLDRNGKLRGVLGEMGDADLCAVAELVLQLERAIPEWKGGLKRALLDRARSPVRGAQEPASFTARPPHEVTVSWRPSDHTRALLVADTLAGLTVTGLRYVNSAQALAAAQAAYEGTNSSAQDARAEALVLALVEGSLDASGKSLWLGAQKMPFLQASEEILSSRFGADPQLGQALARIREVLFAYEVREEVIVGECSSIGEVLAIESALLEDNRRGRLSYGPFAKSLVILARGESARAVTVRARNGTPLRVDIAFAATQDDGTRLMFLDRCVNARSDDSLIPAVIDWARQAVNAGPAAILSFGLLSRSPSFDRTLLGNATAEADSQRVCVNQPDTVAGFFLGGGALTDIDGIVWGEQRVP